MERRREGRGGIGITLRARSERTKRWRRRRKREKREQERCNQGLGQGGPVTRREEEVILNHDSDEEREEKRKRVASVCWEGKWGQFITLLARKRG